MFSSASVFLLLGLLASAMGSLSIEEYEKATEECIVEIGVSEEAFEQLLTMEEPVDEKLKCFGACMLKKFSQLKADGTFDVDKAISDLPDEIPDKENVATIMHACADKKGANDCETSHLLFKCFVENKVYPTREVPMKGDRPNYSLMAEGLG